jgi:ribosomal protein S18 acetylase RimI-like enzyme
MINENYYYDIQEAAEAFRHTSFQYLDYDECKNSDVLIKDHNIIVLLDKSKSPARVHFAADDFDLLIPLLSQLDGDLQINFVPHEYRDQLESIGFFTWAEYIDYFNRNLAEIAGNKYYNDIVFLSRNECEIVSALSKSCANESRGFTGETSKWFSDWVDENDVIIVRQNNEIAGYCCVSIYNEGSTLWVREIAVAPVFQGKGLGKKLMEQAICYGLNKGAEKAFLAADVLNYNAIKLYTRYGFQAKDKKGELQMRRIIKSS